MQDRKVLKCSDYKSLFFCCKSQELSVFDLVVGKYINALLIDIDIKFLNRKVSFIVK